MIPTVGETTLMAERIQELLGCRYPNWVKLEFYLIIKVQSVTFLAPPPNGTSEFFNTLNHPQFANPDTFRVISSTAVNPRVIQLALRLSF
jgi:hypothetical protein